MTTLHNISTLLQNEIKSDTIELSSDELKRLHDMALGLVQLLRPMLGLEKLQTGRQIRRERYG